MTSFFCRRRRSSSCRGWSGRPSRRTRRSTRSAWRHRSSPAAITTAAARASAEWSTQLPPSRRPLQRCVPPARAPSAHHVSFQVGRSAPASPLTPARSTASRDAVRARVPLREWTSSHASGGRLAAQPHDVILPARAMTSSAPVWDSDSDDASVQQHVVEWTSLQSAAPAHAPFVAPPVVTAVVHQQPSRGGASGGGAAKSPTNSVVEECVRKHVSPKHSAGPPCCRMSRVLNAECGSVSISN